jgi:Na+-translocating ferredoxin:NAD+ oxidoreductase RNF subunit RnfB
MLGIPAPVAWAIGSMVLLGVLFSVGLVFAARRFHVEEDPRISGAVALLPGINCGACGYTGCQSYAEAVVKGEKLTFCAVGGPDVARTLAELMGVEIGEIRRLRAVVHCQGGPSRCADRFLYVGPEDCRAAHITSGGQKSCLYGCLGLGSCARACPFQAMAMSADMLPVIDPDKCTACGICVRTCPRDLISLLPAEFQVYLGCSSHDRGKAVKDVCSVGCIACGLCVKNDPHQATQLVDNLPVLDFEKAHGDFRKGAEVCPMNCFVVEEAAPVAAGAPGAAGAAAASAPSGAGT